MNKEYILLLFDRIQGAIMSDQRYAALGYLKVLKDELDLNEGGSNERD